LDFNAALADAENGSQPLSRFAGLRRFRFAVLKSQSRS
jgi:hypothetical protein